MNCFGDWFAAKFPALVPPRRAVTTMEPEEPQLPEGLYEAADGTLMATCRVCDSRYECPVPAHEFDPNYSYCGGSPRCCP